MAVPPPSGKRLLLVEDNLVNQKVVLAILRKKGYHIDVANHGREALDKLESSAPYNLILMDVQMPVLDGLEAARIIRRSPQWNELPIIAMTAHAMNGDRERCIGAGMDAYISKPVQPAHLIATIETYLLAGPSTTTPAEPTIASALTDRLMTDDSALMNDMLQLFLQLAPGRLEKIQTAAGEADPHGVTREAKMIGSAADQFASKDLGAVARKIEQAADRGDFLQVKVDLETLRREIRALETLVSR